MSNMSKVNMSPSVRKRIAFVFNHYDNHQIIHAAPYAFALSRQNDLFDVHILCSSPSQLVWARKIGQAYKGHNCQFTVLKIPALIKVIDPFVSKWVFIRKQAALKANAKLFSSFDAIISPERTTAKLHDNYGVTKPNFIRILHGAGDRDGGMSMGSEAFGLTLLPGEKGKQMMLDGPDAQSSHFVVSGYAKFEAVEKMAPKIQKFFSNDNPTIVYAPHFYNETSSWPKMGVEILDFFRENTEYNLIFAPHVILFKRARRHKAHLPKRFVNTDTMLIDVGSQCSVDMSYMRAADIYLGDASSQVYEFLARPRPCIFVDAHQTNWQDNDFYRHWKFGKVIRNIPALKDAIDNAASAHAAYLPVQEKMFDYSFSDIGSLAGMSVSEYGAKLIADHLLKPKNGPVSKKNEPVSKTAAK